MGKEMLLWWRKEVEPQQEEEDEKSAVVEEEFGWKCWKHPRQPPYGVCADCLRDRLLRLCPNCAKDRPCRCFPSPSSSISSSSASSAELAGSRGGVDDAGVGAVGLMSRLIESEISFCRSRSVGYELIRSRSAAAAAAGEASVPPRPRGSGRGWGLFWPFSRAGSGMKESPKAGLFRSRTVAAGRSSVAGGSGEEEETKRKGARRWHFPSPMKVFPSSMKVFRQRKPASTKVVA
ncbi:hypothetical protein Cni_G15040 [Canna indica]|uniref:Uncharacterized protein n=1 Tax=Canna indica TaxID=4628 RepID=A0AAQ3KG48_9LILI|nr:hypothetical protein Cni_G15040 [Canna indica]